MDHPSQGKTQMFRRGLDDAGFQQVRHQMELPCIHKLVLLLQDLFALLQLFACCSSIAQSWAYTIAGCLSKHALVLLMQKLAWGGDDFQLCMENTNSMVTRGSYQNRVGCARRC